MYLWINVSPNLEQKMLLKLQKKWIYFAKNCVHFCRLLKRRKKKASQNWIFFLCGANGPPDGRCARRDANNQSLGQRNQFSEGVLGYFLQSEAVSRRVPRGRSMSRKSPGRGANPTYNYVSLAKYVEKKDHLKNRHPRSFQLYKLTQIT